METHSLCMMKFPKERGFVMSKGWVSHSREASAPVSEVPTAAPALFVPALSFSPSELTARALLSGGTIGALLAITNVYMGLKTGLWETGSIIATLLTFSCMSAFVSRRGNAPTAWRQPWAGSSFRGMIQ